MKLNIIYTALLFLLIIIFNSCQIGTCDEIQKSETMMLIDISDNSLFQEIHADIKTNSLEFMRMNSFEEVFVNSEECKELKLSIAALSAKDELIEVTASAGTDKRGLSRKERRKHNDLTPIKNLVKKTGSTTK